MKFYVYDLVLLVIFTLVVIIFLYKRKKNVKRQGIVFLYKSKLGIKMMNSFAKKYAKLLMKVRYVIVAVGIFLMISIVWLMIEATYLYLSTPISRIVRAPPIAPLLPYFPELFGISSFLPPFPFAYFIIAVGIGGVLHEFAHGIMARAAKLRVKSTGFLFIGPLLGAFVEPDEKQMAKARRLPQLGILGAGTFANVVIALIIGAMTWIFFSLVFVPAGVGFMGYPTAIVDASTIHVPENFSLNATYIEIKSEGKTYLVNPVLLKEALGKKVEKFRVLEDSAAARVGLPISPSVISSIGNEKIKTFEELGEVIKSHNPGEEVVVTTQIRKGFYDINPEEKDFLVKLGEKNGQAYLGVGIEKISNKLSFSMLRNFNNVYTVFGLFDNYTYYESKLGGFGWFVYFLLWWTFFINALLALFNMLPAGPLDGGRFLQLMIGGIFRSDKLGRKAFKLTTFFIILLLVLMMGKWIFGFF